MTDHYKVVKMVNYRRVKRVLDRVHEFTHVNIWVGQERFNEILWSNLHDCVVVIQNDCNGLAKDAKYIPGNVKIQSVRKTDRNIRYIVDIQGTQLIIYLNERNHLL